MVLINGFKQTELIIYMHQTELIIYMHHKKVCQLSSLEMEI